METVGLFQRTRTVVDFKAMRLDVVSDSLHYLGYAVPGASTNQAKWQIRRLTMDLLGSITSEWADGDAEFDNVWDNRATLNYS